MINLSGILKKYKETKNSQQPSAVTISGSVSTPDATDPRMRLSDAIIKDAGRITDSPSKEWYTQSLNQLTAVYRPGLQDLSAGDLESIAGLSDGVISALRDHGVGLLQCVFADYPANDAYVPAHALNTAVMAVELAGALNYAHDRLVELAKAALLHDIGMLGFMPLIGKKEHLSADEYKKVQGHPHRSLDILNKVSKDLNWNIIEGAYQEHERVDGNGYPRGLQGDAIHEYAQIIGIADLYEALTHSRPHRCRHTPLEAVKMIVDQKRGFRRNLLKNFIERFGIFPIGVLVRLSTREVAIVTASNSRSPLRPKVSILFDGQGRRVEEPKHVDLSDHSIIFIDECLEDSACP